MRSNADMTVRVVAEIRQTDSSAPAVSQKACCSPSALRTVSSTTVNAACDIQSRTVGAHSLVHCSCSPIAPSTPRPKSTSGMNASSVWNAIAPE